METQETDAPEVLETPEGTETPEALEEKVELTKAEADELRKKAAERDELESKNKQLFERAKKAEAKTDTLSPSDIVALRDVHADDIGSVQEWSRFKGLPLAEALKDKDLSIILASRAEERRTAEAAITRGGTRGAPAPTGADLLSKAERTGELPDTDEGMAALAEARVDRLKKKKR